MHLRIVHTHTFYMYIYGYVNICLLLLMFLLLHLVILFKKLGVCMWGSDSYVEGCMGFCLLSSFLLLSTRYVRYLVAM